ncbi:MAG: hypothetical protein ACRDIA_00025 [Actinomycetota bacterium]
MKTERRIGKVTRAASLAGLGLVLLGASVAWACTAQFYLSQVTPSAVPSRASVSLVGATPEQTPVEIRWNTETGPRVDTAVTRSGSSFSSQVTVPDSTPGVYYLVVVSNGRKLASAPIQVTDSLGQAGSSARAAGDLWTGFDADQPSTDGLGGVSKAPGGPKAGLLLGAGLLAVGGAAVFSAVVVAGRTRRRSAKAES